MFGKTIYQIRKSKGYSLSQLAERVGISKSYLSNIEREIKKNPSIHVMGKIALALDMDLNELLRYGEEQAKEQQLEKEWLDFLNELMQTGVNKEQIHDYKILVEFMRWYNERNAKE
jgi:transcriptional regulator with XRE-family HTH domain